MRVLFVRRQMVGGVARHCTLLAERLTGMGIDVAIEDAQEAIPNATGKKIDRQVSAYLREIANGFDLVHAFGYRSAWACAEAFGQREAWLYTAYDLPKTTHPDLIQRLDRAQMGLCSSEAVRRVLREAMIDELRVVVPGVEPAESSLGAAEGRARLGVPDESPMIFAAGQFVPDGGFGALLAAMETVWARLPDAMLVIAGDGPEHGLLVDQAQALSRTQQVLLVPWIETADEFGSALGCADVIVIPHRKKGFSMVAAEAMALSKTVLMRRTGGLPEMIEERTSGFLFDLDSDLGDAAAGLLQSPLTLGVVGNAARVRAEERFDMGECATTVRDVYQEVLEG